MTPAAARRIIVLGLGNDPTARILKHHARPAPLRAIPGLGNDPTARILKHVVAARPKIRQTGLGNDPTARILKRSILMWRSSPRVRV